MKTKKYIGTVLVIFSLLLLAGCGATGSTDEGENSKIQAQDTEEESSGQNEETETRKDTSMPFGKNKETRKDTDTKEDADVEEKQIMIEVNGQSFSAKLYDNAAAAALLEKFPMVLDMEEMNGNEKYFFMEDTLPTDTKDIGDIHTGDIMLYGADCLVLFFQDFSTSYRYTRIGYIEDQEGFADALSDGTVEIRFYIEE